MAVVFFLSWQLYFVFDPDSCVVIDHGICILLLAMVVVFVIGHDRCVLLLIMAVIFCYWPWQLCCY